ncbi:NADH dehydrogenase [ubiquinone] 1 beta subcomplex subunit 9 [Raphanus sativus]|uniref:NADH dehydrogenase [ubiquinone] 1 beta subcomplex subunit 9 n=1 Tax=Raphanus sativus TaxID=3726 RepID=A0A6J0M8B1_RAPSA|nr:NADH dehydrogenase [ubiquinone] 1 beta subcomplex subunit 9 [Raphanus sativus]KAJ4870866.1 NADH dehydrogenase [ubiquinone] 1 beta subcomplex subunit 9 [Raphanus sativus]
MLFFKSFPYGPNFFPITGSSKTFSSVPLIRPEAEYPRRRAAQKERVRILYRRALKDTLNWAVHRHIFYRDASDLREKFNANQDVEDVDRIDKLIAHGEAEYDKWRHPDPYIVPWAPGGSKFCRNPTPPAGIEIVYNYGQEDNP